MYPPKMTDVEKSLGPQPPTAGNMSSMVEPEKVLLSDDAGSSEVVKDKPEKKKEGGVKDYFVSDESEHLR